MEDVKWIGEAMLSYRGTQTTLELVYPYKTLEKCQTGDVTYWWKAGIKLGTENRGLVDRVWKRQTLLSLTHLWHLKDPVLAAKYLSQARDWSFFLGLRGGINGSRAPEVSSHGFPLDKANCSNSDVEFQISFSLHYSEMQTAKKGF